MKIYKEVKCSERLPNKEDSYFVVMNKDFKTKSYFNGNRFESSQYDIVEYWLEPIEIELDSEKILPKEERTLKTLSEYGLNNLLSKYVKALNSAELEIINLKEQYTICKEIADRRKEQVDLLTSDANERYEKAMELANTTIIVNNSDICCGLKSKSVDYFIKIAAYGKD